MTVDWACPVCYGEDIQQGVRIDGLPVVCNLLWENRQPAMQIPRGRIILGRCRRCNHIFNAAFQAGLVQYTRAYENALHFSPAFRAYAEALASGLVERNGLLQKRILEIGAGQGDFLRLICALGDNSGMGFDPAYRPENAPEDPRVRMVPDSFQPGYCNKQADLVCARHVLEHHPRPGDFLDLMAGAFDPKGKRTLYIEVPNGDYMLEETAIWDLIYEHRSFFTRDSLAWLLQAAGYGQLRINEGFGGQFLCAEGQFQSEPASAPAGPDFGRRLEERFSAFCGQVIEKTRYWDRTLAEMASGRKRTVVWGAGSKGIAFLNMVPHAASVRYAVDINPRKQGKFISGSGQRIVEPEFLKVYKPDVVLVMNPNYAEEINQMLGKLGISPMPYFP